MNDEGTEMSTDDGFEIRVTGLDRNSVLTERELF